MSQNFKKEILSMLISLGMACAYAQPLSLLHTSMHSSFNTGFCKLDVLKSDKIIYGCDAGDLDANPFQYGLWDDQFATDELVEDRSSTIAFLNENWTSQGFIEFSSSIILSGSSYFGSNWMGVAGNIYVGTLGLMLTPFFNLPYNVIGNPLITEQEPSLSIVAYHPSTQTLRPLIAFQQQDGDLINGIPSYIRRATSTSLHQLPTRHRGTSINGTDVITYLDRAGWQFLNGNLQPQAPDPGYYLIKANAETGELVTQEIANPGGIVLMHGIFKSGPLNTYYAVKTIRGGNAIYDASGQSFGDIPSDSSYVTIFTKENSDGTALWATRLYDYNNTFDDTQFEALALLRAPANAVAIGQSVYYAEYTDVTIADGDVMTYRDVFENSVQVTEQDLFLTLVSGFPALRMGFSQSKVYQLHAETGVANAQIALVGKHYVRSNALLYLLQPTPLVSFQEPYIFQVGDSLAWVHNIFAQSDSVVEFKRTNAAGVITNYNVAVEPGHNLIIAWLNADLQLTSHWLIPAQSANPGVSSAVSITSISSFMNNTVLLAANIDRTMSTSMDPFGVEPVVNYPNQRTSFLGVYGVDTSIGILESPQANESFALYPNPSSGSVDMVPPPGFGASQYILFDAVGRIVTSGNFTATTSTTHLDFQGLRAGAYVLTIRDGDRLARQKLIIQ